MDLIAKLPTLAAAIYRNLYRDGKVGTEYSCQLIASESCGMGSCTKAVQI